MRNLAFACSQTTRQSIVIVDELGRGTSSCEGAGIAWAAAEWLSDVRCAALFTTHFSQLTEMETEDNTVANFHMSVVPAKQPPAAGRASSSLQFTYQLQRGPCHVLRYGMLLAEHVGFCPNVLARSRVIEAAAERQLLTTSTPEDDSDESIVRGPIPPWDLRGALEAVATQLARNDLQALLEYQAKLLAISSG
jgi:DNA mismatch repair ATPase MutS